VQPLLIGTLVTGVCVWLGYQHLTTLLLNFFHVERQTFYTRRLLTFQFSREDIEYIDWLVTPSLLYADVDCQLVSAVLGVLCGLGQCMVNT